MFLVISFLPIAQNHQLSLINLSKAQDEAATTAADAGGGDPLAGTMKDLIIVGGCGLGGAILGLSTLSFHKEPREHMRNILVGGSLGIIIGVAVVAYSQAAKGQQLYNLEDEGGAQARSYFPGHERTNWHFNNHQRISSAELPFQASMFNVMTTF